MSKAGKQETADDGIARDEILYLPLASIDADPEQPRLDVDAELADSIAQHGVLQAIQVRPHPVDADRWMIVDGERRYRGSLAAKASTIPATITLEVEDAGERIIRQIVRNEGKPLTPVEEALAFKKIIDGKRAAGDKKYGVVQLARELGYAKSTISDRLMLTEIPAFWLELIANGPLQASHATLLHRWRLVPEKYQRHALGQMQADSRWPGGETYSKAKKGERIYGKELETLIRTYMPKFIKPVSDVPGYEGPTEKMRVDSYDASPKVYAMDRSKWEPIWRQQIAAKRSTQGKTAAKTKATNEARQPKWVKSAVDGGAQLIEGRQYFSVNDFSYSDALNGCTPIIDRGHWHFKPASGFGGNRPFDTAVLRRELDLSKLVIIKATGHDGRHAVTQWYPGTRDNAALGQARSAYLAVHNEARAEILEAFGREGLVAAEAAGRDQLIFGGAAPSLVKAIVDGDPETLTGLLYSYALAARVDGIDDVDATKPANVLAWLRALDREPAETILNTIAIAERDHLEPPPARMDAWEQAALAAYAKVKIVWGDDAPDSADDEETEDDDALTAAAADASDDETHDDFDSEDADEELEPEPAEV